MQVMMPAETRNQAETIITRMMDRVVKFDHAFGMEHNNADDDC